MARHEAQALLSAPFHHSPTMALIDAVAEGLPFNAADELSAALAPKDPAFRYQLVPKATYARRKLAQRLSPQESERLVRLSRVWGLALEIWREEDAARQFLWSPHMLLQGRSPLDVSMASELGGKKVEELMGQIIAGVGV